MPEPLSGLLGALARRLPRRARDRWFAPTWHELRSAHVAASAGRPTVVRALLAGRLRLQGFIALLQCALLLWHEHGARRRRHVPGVDPMLVHDLRYAVRLLAKAPGFSLAAIATLALGIGANTAMFSVVHAVLLRPLPFHDPASLLALNETAQGGLTTISLPNLRDWKAQNGSFSGIAAYRSTTTTLSDDAGAERMGAALVEADLFTVLGVSPLAGRLFTAADDEPAGPPVVALGYRTWWTRFGGDRTLLGRTLTFDGRSREVVAILPTDVSFPDGIDVWFPLQAGPDEYRDSQRGAHSYSAVGRLRPGVSRQQATADLARIEQGIAARFRSVEGYGVWARPLLDATVGSARRPLLLLLGAVGFVLLIACVNVSNLLMARAGARRVEMGVRSALGAGRWRLFRQLLAESLVLAAAGGIAGVLLAAWGVRALDGLIPGSLPRAQAIGVSLSVLIFTAAVSMATGALFGVFPAIQASRSNVAALLREATRDGASAGSRRGVRQVLVAAEVALALVLMTGAGLALRSFDRLSRVDPGFDPTGALAITIALPDSRYPDAAAASGLVQQYVEGLATRPGVIAAGAVMSPPLGGGSFAGTFTIVASDTEAAGTLQVRPATPGYFESLAIPLRRGRTFTRDDRTGGFPVAVISEEAARRYWPGQDPVGQRLRIHVSMLGAEPEREIVGVVGDVSLRSLDSAQLPAVYVPHAQYYSGRMTVFVRTSGDPLALAPVAKAQLAALDRQIAPIIRPATQIVAASVAQPRFRLVLFGAFAVIALALAGVGLYGVMAFAVSQRQAEIGVRMALGADGRSVLRMVLWQAMVPVGAGLAAGLLGAAALTRTLSTLLFQTSAFDPLTYAAVALLLTSVAAAASYIPARRAARIDPIAALRTS